MEKNKMSLSRNTRDYCKKVSQTSSWPKLLRVLSWPEVLGMRACDFKAVKTIHPKSKQSRGNPKPISKELHSKTIHVLASGQTIDHRAHTIEMSIRANAGTCRGVRGRNRYLAKSRTGKRPWRYSILFFLFFLFYQPATRSSWFRARFLSVALLSTRRSPFSSDVLLNRLRRRRCTLIHGSIQIVTIENPIDILCTLYESFRNLISIVTRYDRRDYIGKIWKKKWKYTYIEVTRY